MWATAGTGQDQPLSAIDWLTQDTRTPFQQVNPTDFEEPVATSIVTETITVTSLDDAVDDIAGLMPLDLARLPEALWSGANPDAMRAALADMPHDLLPAARDLLYRVVLARAPSDSQITAARVDTLLRFGAIQPAFAMYDAVAPDTAEGFGHFFDAALLTWQVSPACSLLAQTPSLSRRAADKVYCTARVGDWDTAVLQYFTHDALGDIPRPINKLLGGFLDPTLAEELEFAPVNAQAISPLEFRLRESVGAAVPTTGLPLKFVATDLQPAAGWRAQIEAAERLAASGALPAETLFEIYGLGKAAASGGVWERVRMVAALENARGAGDKVAMQSVLPDLWTSAQAAKLRLPFAQALADNLEFIRFTDDASQTIRQRILWLAQDTGAIPDDLLNLAPKDTVTAITLAFDETLSPRPVTAQAILQTLSNVRVAQDGDLNALQLALVGLRSLGFEAEARALAVQYLILVADL